MDPALILGEHLTEQDKHPMLNYHKSAATFDLHVYTWLVIIPQLRYSSLESSSFL